MTLYEYQIIYCTVCDEKTVHMPTTVIDDKPAWKCDNCGTITVELEQE
jgi:hypothetical protein